MSYNLPPGTGSLPGEDDNDPFDVIDIGFYTVMLDALNTSDVEELEAMTKEISEDEHLMKLYFKEFLECISLLLAYRSEK